MVVVRLWPGEHEVDVDEIPDAIEYDGQIYVRNARRESRYELANVFKVKKVDADPSDKRPS